MTHSHQRKMAEKRLFWAFQRGWWPVRGSIAALPTVAVWT
jgi:hypothetical protein